LQKGIIYVELLNGVTENDLLIVDDFINDNIKFYMNPEIMYNGDVYNIDLKLTNMCINNDKLEQNEVYFSNKVWIRKKGKNKDKSGCFHDRTSYYVIKGLTKEEINEQFIKVMKKRNQLRK
jgi:hypothetical protein